MHFKVVMMVTFRLCVLNCNKGKMLTEPRKEWAKQKFAPVLVSVDPGKGRSVLLQ